MSDPAPLLLTDAELAELTGYVRPHMQRRWLEKRGWPFVENAAGHPRVLRSVAHQKMGASVSKPERQRPNFGALNEPSGMKKQKR